MKKGDTEQLYITDITAHGMGVGHSKDGAAVFVRGALPGDTVIAECCRAKKRYSDAENQDSEKFECVEGIDSRIIVIKLFEYCQKQNVQYMMMGAMGTNGLNFPLYVIVREIVNSYCYWLGQLAFDSTSPLNVILSLQKKDITRHAGELSKIISYIHWMIDRRKETITNKKNWA